MNRINEMTVTELIKDAKAYYEAGNGNGGNLHVVLEDGNLDKPSIEFCLKLARSKKDSLGTTLAQKLLLANLMQRKQLYKNYEEYAG